MGRNAVIAAIVIALFMGLALLYDSARATRPAPPLALNTGADGIYLSIVLAMRNDDYGETLHAERNETAPGRLLRSISHLTAALDVAGLAGAYEIVVCEYNPDRGRPLLIDALPWPVRLRGRLSFVRVEAPNLHYAELYPFWEFIGQNVAARRTRGEYLLFMNGDSIVHARIAQFIAARALYPYAVYRAARLSARLPFDTFGDDWAALDAVLAANVSARVDDDLYETMLSAEPYTDAVGDFFLLHRSLFMLFGGFPEMPFSQHIDGLALRLALCMRVRDRSVRQYALPYPIYHQGHSGARMLGEPPEADWAMIWRYRERMCHDRPIVDSAFFPLGLAVALGGIGVWLAGLFEQRRRWLAAFVGAAGAYFVWLASRRFGGFRQPADWGLADVVLERVVF